MVYHKNATDSPTVIDHFYDHLLLSWIYKKFAGNADRTHSSVPCLGLHTLSQYILRIPKPMTGATPDIAMDTLAEVLVKYAPFQRPKLRAAFSYCSNDH